jgi:flagellar basal body-associated protein FliL
MSESEQKTAAAASPPAKKSSLGIFALILPAILAGGAAFGGAKIAGAHAAAPPTGEHAAPAPAKPPGPTLPLEPFLVTISDAAKKQHPMKVTLAIEFDGGTKEDTLKAFTPRVRDAALSFLRTMPYEDAIDPKTDKVRAELLERVRQIGATHAERVLITDLVVQ